ncbi:DUF4160 domain-containing protein [Yoonia sp.]|uniref:DUF4160 domain-containing protein n=1 Tax=Yoonia sp. TaxID=2212373 RepID=UPI00358E5B31
MKEYVVEIDQSLQDELFQDFLLGPIVDIDESGNDDKRMLMEVYVAHVKAAKVEVFSREHPPPHFRVLYQGSSANYEISDCTRMNGSGQVLRFEKNIKKWWKKNKEKLIEIWNERRPSDCPVGEYRE